MYYLFIFKSSSKIKVSIFICKVLPQGIQKISMKALGPSSKVMGNLKAYYYYSSIFQNRPKVKVSVIYFGMSKSSSYGSMFRCLKGMANYKTVTFIYLFSIEGQISRSYIWYSMFDKVPRL